MSEQNQPTLDQRRAKHAWEAVARMAENKKNQAEYQRATKQLPVRILTAGLGHALAFLHAKAKGREANNALLQDLADWVLYKRKNLEHSGAHSAPSALIEEITKRDSAFLRATTDEVLAYLQWLTRFAEAELKDS